MIGPTWLLIGGSESQIFGELRVKISKSWQADDDKDGTL